ncbi:hypothetical protein ACIN8IBEIGE_210253 [Acinetobacter sp. 8I-beige]|nr:hypothetical protein ACIN8IBEIGE_210253 [Acinetobacter sp. 8I-beige]
MMLIYRLFTKNRNGEVAGMPPLGCGIGMYYQPNKEFCLLLLFQK